MRSNTENMVILEMVAKEGLEKNLKGLKDQENGFLSNVFLVGKLDRCYCPVMNLK